MREFKKLPLELFIGYDIEQNSRVIELDASEMVEKYPSGILQLVCKRPGEETTYIAPSFEQDGGTLRWTLTSYDVEKAGQGLAIVALVDTSEESVKVLASHKIRTGIEEGLHFRDAESVDPEDSLIARVLAAVSQAQAYAQDAAEALGDVQNEHDQAIADIEAKTVKDYVTPEMFGAVGNSVNDDTNAVKSAFNSGKNVIFAGKYRCTETITIQNASLCTISGINYNTSGLKFVNGAKLIIGSNSNVNELRLNNFTVEGDGTQDVLFKIQYVTNVYLHQINIAEAGNYLLELDHADIVFMDGCTFAGSNKLDTWWPCSGVKLTSANPVYVKQCNIWNLINAFEIIGTTRTLNITECWVEFVKEIVHASNTTISNCIINVSNNNLVFSPHGETPNHIKSRIVMLDTITTGFDITINVINNYINFYTAYPTEALVELISVPSTVNVNILRNNMFTRLAQMDAYALKVDAKNDTRLNYESTTNADSKYGCQTAGITNIVTSPITNNIRNLNITSDQKTSAINQNDGDLWYENSAIYLKVGANVRSLPISMSESISDIADPTTATTSDVALKLNALMGMLRRTKIVR